VTKPGRGKVVFSYVHPAEAVTAAFHHSLIGLLTWDMSHKRRIIGGGGLFPVVSGANIVNARNLVIRTFLDDHDAEWLFSCDTDHAFASDTVDRLVEAADPTLRPIMGGLYYGIWHASGQPEVFPQIFYWTDDGVARATTWLEGEVIRVGATGAGCLLIHRTVLEAVRGKHPEPWPWFAESVLYDRPVSEDITFCMRAGALGFPVHVHTGVEAGHQKPHILTSADYKEPDR
jgi:hypothetical protein